LIASRYWAQLLVADAETLLGRQAEDADLALVGVVVDVEGRLADVVDASTCAKGSVGLALRDQPIGLPRLAVVSEVRGMIRGRFVQR